MAVSFTNFSWWAWNSKEKDKVSSNSSGSSSSVSEWGLTAREPETIKLTQISSRKVKRKWPSREERRVEREYEYEYEHDAVMVPSDGACLSGSESDDSDWSVGWLEPHGSDFLTDNDELDNTFAVLVPCYRSGCKEVVESPNVQFLSAIKGFSNDYSAESKKLTEQWLCSLES